MSESTEPDLADLYRQTRLRLTDLVAGLDISALATPVPACPGWAVRDVIAHLTAVAQDAVAGQLAGPPSTEQTAEQVARLARVAVPDIAGLWATAAPQFERQISARGVWPAVVDVASHEQDIRGALRMPGARDSTAIRQCTAWLLSELKVPVPLLIITEDGAVAAGPGGAADPALPARAKPTLTLSTSRFEAFRWRMGRRSFAQLRALSWSGDPAVLLDQLTVFGPAVSDIDE
jgi:uncharacterized protein (TIGR03083 family)